MSTPKFKLFLLLFILASFQSRASHIMGGEITYKWVSGNDYVVTTYLYRDCAGIAISTSVDIGVYSNSCQDSFQVSLPEISVDMLTPSCNTFFTSCSGGTAFGFERHVYADTVTLPFACNDWKFIYASCCRNSNITNLTSGGGAGAYFYATLDNLNTPFNNSPVFTADPIITLSAGQSYTLNNGAFDPDGDSMVVSLTPALDGSINAPSAFSILTYNAPLSYSNPVNSVPPLALDPLTGDITLSPQLNEVDVVVYTVEEYRNGLLIGSTTRDLQIIIQSGSNQLPTLSGINGTANFIISMCYLDTLQFTINSDDADINDSLAISWNTFTGANSGSTNYTFTTAGVKHDSATFAFTPDSSQISSLPYFLYVSIKDNACPYYGIQTYCYVIYVNSCSQDVWPGDANADLQVNMYDLLPIGLAYNDTGSVRSGASLAWNGQPCTDWNSAFLSGVNHKHADCNGDGIVNASDTSGIYANFGLTHPPKLLPQIPSVSTAADLYLIASPDTVSASNIVNVKVCLGTSSVPVDSIYGIAFRINFNPGLIDSTSGTMNYSGSWMGIPGTDLLTFEKPATANGYADVAMVRTNHTNISGDSTIGVFSIVIVDNIAGKMGLPFSLSDVYAITYSESVLNLNLSGDTVIVNTTTGINDPQAKGETISMYPIPAGNFLEIKSGAEKMEEIILSDLSGRKIQIIKPGFVHKANLYLGKLSNGLYLVSVKTSHGILNRRISVSGK